MYVGDSGHNRIVVLFPNGTQQHTFTRYTHIQPPKWSRRWTAWARYMLRTVTTHQLVVLAPKRHAAAFLQGQLSSPAGVAVDLASGEIYVADSGNNRIVVLSASGVLLQSIKMGFKAPNAVAVSTAGTIYVADSGNNRVVTLMGVLDDLHEVRGTMCVETLDDAWSEVA